MAFEVTKLVHGEEKAVQAQEGARAAFGGDSSSENIPSTTMNSTLFEGEGIGLLDLLRQIGLIESNSEGFRLVKQRGLLINDVRVENPKLKINKDDFKDEKLNIQKGKKVFHNIIIK